MQAPTDLTAPDLAAVDSPEGRAWMAAVPSLLHDLGRLWGPITAGDGELLRVAQIRRPRTGQRPGSASRQRLRYSRGSTGSDSSASTPNTASWTRHNGSPRAPRSSASSPRAYSRSASDRLRPRLRSRSRARLAGSV
jgi:hypothetical protein